MKKQYLSQSSSETYAAPVAEVILFHTEDVIFESGDNDVAFGA